MIITLEKFLFEMDYAFCFKIWETKRNLVVQ